MKKPDTGRDGGEDTIALGDASYEDRLRGLNKYRFKISGSYPPDTAARRVSSYYAGHDTYSQVDAAIREPVRILNEEFGLKTLWSCEGHEHEWSGNNGLLGNIYDGDDNVTGRTSQESYIALSPNYIENVDRFVFYLRSIGFKEGSTVRPLCNGKYYSVYCNFEGGHLEADVKESREEDIATIFLRVGSHRVDMSCATTHEHKGHPYKNLSDSISGSPAIDQAGWDALRDEGWEMWLSILSRYIGQS